MTGPAMEAGVFVGDTRGGNFNEEYIQTKHHTSLLNRRIVPLINWRSVTHYLPHSVIAVKITACPIS